MKHIFEEKTRVFQKGKIFNLSDYWAVGLLGCRTTGLSDYWDNPTATESQTKVEVKNKYHDCKNQDFMNKKTSFYANLFTE